MGTIFTSTLQVEPEDIHALTLLIFTLTQGLLSLKLKQETITQELIQAAYRVFSHPALFVSSCGTVPLLIGDLQAKQVLIGHKLNQKANKSYIKTSFLSIPNNLQYIFLHIIFPE